MESTRRPPDNISWVRASSQVLPPRQRLSAGGGGRERRGGAVGENEEGKAFILSSNGDVTTKGVAHSPQGF